MAAQWHTATVLSEVPTNPDNWSIWSRKKILTNLLVTQLQQRNPNRVLLLFKFIKHGNKEIFVSYICKLKHLEIKLIILAFNKQMPCNYQICWEPFCLNFELRNINLTRNSYGTPVDQLHLFRLSYMWYTCTVILISTSDILHVPFHMAEVPLMENWEC